MCSVTLRMNKYQATRRCLYKNLFIVFFFSPTLRLVGSMVILKELPLLSQLSDQMLRTFSLDVTRKLCA